MIIITSNNGTYSIDEETERVFKDGVLVSGVDVDIVYSGNGEDRAPKISGILFKGKGTILTLSGKESKIIDPNMI